MFLQSPRSTIFCPSGTQLKLLPTLIVPFFFFFFLFLRTWEALSRRRKDAYGTYDYGSPTRQGMSDFYFGWLKGMPQVGKEQRAKYRVSTAHMMPWNCRKGKAVLVEILILLRSSKELWLRIHQDSLSFLLFILCNISQLFWNIFKNLLVTSVSLHGKVLSNNAITIMIMIMKGVHFIFFFFGSGIVAQNWQKNSLLDEEELSGSLQEGLQKQRLINIIFLFGIFSHKLWLFS